MLLSLRAARVLTATSMILPRQTSAMTIIPRSAATAAAAAAGTTADCRSWHSSSLSLSSSSSSSSSSQPMLMESSSGRSGRRSSSTSSTRSASTSSSSSSSRINSMISSIIISKSPVGNAVEHAMMSLYNADAVCFDVDSTVIAEEGIDVLAEYLGKGEAVAAMTKQAMEGGMAFQDALSARLELLQPSKQSIQRCLNDQPFQLTDGVQQLIQALQEKNVDVWLVSGGFRIMIEPVAQRLNIPIQNIYANTLLFHNDVEGSYQSFDPAEPTSADMGKPKALTLIQKQKGYQAMVMVGDGATDAQAKPPAKTFIGFGGVVERAAVKAKADWFVTDFQDLTSIIMQRN